MKNFTPGSLLLYFALFFTLLLIGQNQHSNAQTRKNKKQTKTVLTFEKKPCFGFCPVYKAVFQKDGNVLVTYRQPGKEEAKTQFRLSAKELCSLWKRGENLGFFQMKDRYETLRTDFPEREITLYKRNKPKTVIYTEGGSPEFESYIEDLAALVESKINVDFSPPTRE